MSTAQKPLHTTEDMALVIQLFKDISAMETQVYHNYNKKIHLTLTLNTVIQFMYSHTLLIKVIFNINSLYTTPRF